MIHTFYCCVVVLQDGMKRNEAYDPVTLLIENDAYNVLNIRSGRCSHMTGETPSPPHIYDEPMFLTGITSV